MGVGPNFDFFDQIRERESLINIKQICLKKKYNFYSYITIV